MSKQKNTNTFITEARKVHGNKYNYSKVQYTATHTKVCIICPKHGEFYQAPSKHLKGQGCPVCAYIEKGKAKSAAAAAAFIQKAKVIHNNIYDYSAVQYESAHKPVTIICPVHGAFQQSPNSHLNGRGCPKCKGIKISTSRTLTGEEFVKRATALYGNIYDYSEVQYTHSKQPVTIICKKHGKFQQRPNDHLNGHGCPSCGVTLSHGEEELLQWLQNKAPHLHCTRKDKKILNGKEIDILCSEKNIGLEYNGSYWHHGEHKDKNYHQDKVLNAEAAGVELIHVHDYLWHKRKTQYLSLICSKLGIISRIEHGRKCKVKEIECKLSMAFCEKYHIQGAANAAIHLGLFLGDELLAVFTAGVPRFNKHHSWEIIRMCCLPGLRVHGGFGKLWKHFLNHYVKSGESVCTYAQLDWSLGKVYRALGFEYKRNTEPGFVWVTSDGRDYLPRYKTQKHKLKSLLEEKFDPTMSETENMKNAGYLQVWNAGTRLFVFKKKYLTKH